MIANMLSNKKLNRIVTELLFRGRKLNISLIFITQSYSVVPNSRLNCVHYFIMKIPFKREIQRTECNYLSDTGFKDFMTYKKIL